MAVTSGPNKPLTSGPNHPVNCAAPAAPGSARKWFVTIEADSEAAPFTAEFTTQLEERIHGALEEDNIRQNEYELEWDTSADGPKSVTMYFSHYVIRAQALCKITTFMRLQLGCKLWLTKTEGLHLFHITSQHNIYPTRGDRSSVGICNRVHCNL